MNIRVIISALFAIALITVLAVYLVLVPQKFALLQSWQSAITKYFGLNKYLQTDYKNNNAKPAVNDVLDGQLILELNKRNENIKKLAPATYAINFINNVPHLQKAPNGIKREDSFFKFSKQGYVIYTKPSLDGKNNPYYQVFLMSIKMGYGGVFDAQTGSPVQVTHSKSHVLVPDIDQSATKIIFFTRAKNAQNKKVIELTAKDYEIYLIKDGENEAHKVTIGMYPKFVTDDKFIYMAPDGIRAYNLATNKSNLLWSLRAGQPDLRNQLVASTAGHSFAVTFPAINALYVFNVKDWNKPEAEFVGSLEGRVSWPMFSTTGNYLAVLRTSDGTQSLDIVKTKGNTANTDLPVIYSMNLSQFNPATAIISDWY